MSRTRLCPATSRFPIPASWIGCKGGENETSESPELTPELVTETPATDIKPVAPETEQAAVFELGATQQALLDTRRELAEIRGENHQLKGGLVALESHLQETRAELAAIIEAQRNRQETDQSHRGASWWERMLGGR